MTAPTKITYTSASGDLEEFHHHFDTAVARVRAASGQLHPFYIDGGAVVETKEQPLVDRSPIDTAFVLGLFAAAIESVVLSSATRLVSVDVDDGLGFSQSQAGRLAKQLDRFDPLALLQRGDDVGGQRWLRPGHRWLLRA